MGVISWFEVANADRYEIEACDRCRICSPDRYETYRLEYDRYEAYRVEHDRYEMYRFELDRYENGPP